MSTFRTRLVLKQWKMPNLHTIMQEEQKQQQQQYAQNLPKNLYQTKTICNQCGKVWDWSMNYCCPEGLMCGMRRRQDQLFIPTVGRAQ